jgi:hypothetical protein
MLRVPTNITVAARNTAAAADIAYLTGSRGHLVASPTRCEPATVDLNDPAAVAALVDRLHPDLVLLAASLQSPWERTAAPSAWTDLLAHGGFGLSLPLQARFAITVADAAAATGSVLVNACFPDAVNPVLHALGRPVCCGIGNAATVAASLGAALRTPGQDQATQLRVLAHHVHLHAPERPDDEALAWLDDVPVPDVARRLAALRASDRQLLNQVTGLTAARAIEALLTGADYRTSVPGPAGLPGGYPVRIADHGVTLDLPAGLTVADAIARNQRWAVADGVVVDGATVRFVGAAAELIETQAPGLPRSFELTGPDVVDAVCDELMALRDRLRK